MVRLKYSGRTPGARKARRIATIVTLAIRSPAQLPVRAPASTRQSTRVVRAPSGGTGYPSGSRSLRDPRSPRRQGTCHASGQNPGRIEEGPPVAAQGEDGSSKHPPMNGSRSSRRRQPGSTALSGFGEREHLYRISAACQASTNKMESSATNLRY